MVGGLNKQIQEIKEVIELPIKHPELFEALGVAQPKVCSLCGCGLLCAHIAAVPRLRGRVASVAHHPE